MTTSLADRVLRYGLTTLLLTLLAVLVPLAPAQAHDRLLESDPIEGAALEEAPDEISLTFSAEVQELASSLTLTDADGGEVSVGSPNHDGETVTTDITDELSAGDYTVRWRVVSSDGHPISGVIDFTVEGEPSATETSEPTSSTSAPAADETTPEQSETAKKSEAADSEEEAGADSGTSTGTILLGIAAVAIVLGGAVALLRSRRRTDS